MVPRAPFTFNEPPTFWGGKEEVEISLRVPYGTAKKRIKWSSPFHQRHSEGPSFSQFRQRRCGSDPASLSHGLGKEEVEVSRPPFPSLGKEEVEVPWPSFSQLWKRRGGSAPALDFPT
jgi:hypothetical protein